MIFNRQLEIFALSPKIKNKNKEIKIKIKKSKDEFVLFALLLASTEDFPLKRAEVFVGEALKISCSVSGPTHAQPDVSWIFNGGKLPENDIVVTNNG